jgi:hypothetical protein
MRTRYHAYHNRIIRCTWSVFNPVWTVEVAQSFVVVDFFQDRETAYVYQPNGEPVTCKTSIDAEKFGIAWIDKLEADEV